MGSSRTSKTAYYLRAIKDGQPFNIQAVLDEARERKPTCDDTEVTLGDGDVVRIQHFVQRSKRTLVHLTRYVPGVQAATLLPKARTPEDDEGAEPPPRGREFKDGDCFLLVVRNHVLYVGHRISKSKATLYLARLFDGAKLTGESGGFTLEPASNIDKLQMIQDHGVRSIQLEVCAFEMSLPKPKRRGWVSHAISAFGDQFSAIISKDQSLATQKALEDLTVTVEITLDGNTRAAESSKKLISELAEDVLDDESGLPLSEFTIVTQKHDRITAAEIRLQTTITVDVKDNSVSHNSAWDQLEAYFEQIKRGNLLEQ